MRVTRRAAHRRALDASRTRRAARAALAARLERPRRRPSRSQARGDRREHRARHRRRARTAAGGGCGARRGRPARCPSSPSSRQRVDQHRDLDAVAGRERQPLEQLAARRDLAGERLAHAGELRVEQRERRARAVRWLTRPPPSGSDDAAVLRTAGGRSALTNDTSGSHTSGPSRPVAKCAEKPSVSASRKHTSSPLEHRQRAPHRVALAEHRAVLGHQLGLLQTLAPARSATAAVPSRGGRVDHDDLVDRARARAAPPARATISPDRRRALARRQAHRHALRRARRRSARRGSSE